MGFFKKATAIGAFTAVSLGLYSVFIVDRNPAPTTTPINPDLYRTLPNGQIDIAQPRAQARDRLVAAFDQLPARFEDLRPLAQKLGVTASMDKMIGEYTRIYKR